MRNLEVCVLFRFSKKSGKIDQTMTGVGSAMMQLWALNNTPKTKSCLIFERNSGKCIFATYGTGDFPKVEKGDLGTCEEYGIRHEDLMAITDDRFDA